MTYSSAIFKAPSDTLEQAQKNKYSRILDILEGNLGKQLNIFEIGSGFGGFAEEALKRGHKVTTITISNGHYSYAIGRLASYIKSGQCRVLLQDYRTIDEEFDAVVSIEMFEAVGLKYWTEYFNTVKKNLKPNGHAVIQAISIKEEYYDDYKNGSDFIRHYIFPGGFLPTITNFKENVKDSSMIVNDVYSFGLDYSKTLLAWLDLFNSKYAEIRSMGYSDEFIKMWTFYLAICAAGFSAERIGVSQFHIVKQ
jgi:cyclopropane-fatty-acyl-phospholipid synthase